MSENSIYCDLELTIRYLIWQWDMTNMKSGPRTLWGGGQSWRVPMDLSHSQPGTTKSFCEWHSYQDLVFTMLPLQNNDFLGTCALVPQSFNNDLGRGTRKVSFWSRSWCRSWCYWAADLFILSLVLGSFWSLDFLIKWILKLTLNFQILTAAHNLKKIGPNEWDDYNLF